MIYFATGSLLTGTVLGAGARLAARRGRSRIVPRQLHQAAFATSAALLAAVTATQWRRNRTVSAANGAALLVLSSLPRTSGWQRRHVQVAALAFMLHLLGVGAHRRSIRHDARH